MMFSKAIFGLLALPFAAALPTTAALNQDFAAPDPTDRYIVTLREGSDLSAATSFVSSIIGKRQLLGSGLLAGIERTFEGAFLGYAGAFDSATIEQIRSSADVAAVEPDSIVTIEALTTQQNPPYGLASISHRSPGATNYIYDDSAGQGGFAYVVDTGINDRHRDFGGRATLAYSAVPLLTPDTVGHGTHCAGTIASNTYGVSKRANILAVKVFAGASTLTSLILEGINWSVNDIVSKNRQGNAVVSMSFGGGRSDAIDMAVRSGTQQGVILVAAAGNSAEDASNSSPAGVPEIITVGAIQSDNQVASYSNFGSVVDVFAPGSNVTSTWIGSDTATNTISGTSMACPHVAGLVLYLQRLEGARTPAAMRDRIVALSTKDALRGVPAGTANRLAYNGNGA